MKQKRELMTCRYCGRPTILYQWLEKNPIEWVESQGPKTHKHIKKWCGGGCDAIVSRMAMLYDDLYYEAKKSRYKSVNIVLKNVMHELKDILDETAEVLKKRDLNVED